MVALPAGAVGGIVLGAVADTASVQTGMVVGAIVLAVAAPLYLVARAASRHSPTAPAVRPAART